MLSLYARHAQPVRMTRTACTHDTLGLHARHHQAVLAPGVCHAPPGGGGERLSLGPAESGPGP